MDHIRDLTARRHRRVGVVGTPRGFLLFPVLVAIGGMILIGAEGLLRARLELVAANRFLAKQQALALAEGRLDEVLVAIAADPATASQWTSCPPPAAASLGTTTCTMGPLGLGTPFVDGPGGIIKREVRIVVSGLVPDALNPRGQQTVEAVVAVPIGTVFDKGLATDYKSIELYDTTVDSYDSSVNRNPATFGSSATLHSASSMHLFESRVWGDAFSNGAFGGPPPVCHVWCGGWCTVPCASRISGVAGTAPPPTFPSVRVPEGSKANLTGPILTSCPGGTLTLNMGSFPYSEIKLPSGMTCTVTLNGSGTLHLNALSLQSAGIKLTVNGNVQMVGGPVSIAGSRVLLGANASFTYYSYFATTLSGDINNPALGSFGRPKDFTVYSCIACNDGGGGGNQVGGTYFGTMYDDGDGVRLLANSRVFGSVIAPTIWMTDAGWADGRLHQDLSLKSEGSVVSPTNPIRRRSWHVK